MARSALPAGISVGDMMVPGRTTGRRTRGAPPPAPDDSGDVIVTITKIGAGSYMVYAGDEPDGGSADISRDDAAAMGGAGGVPAHGGGMGGGAAGQPADSIGAAVKLAHGLLLADKSSEGAPGNADDQLAAGYGADRSPTPASGPIQKY